MTTEYDSRAIASTIADGAAEVSKLPSADTAIESVLKPPVAAVRVRSGRSGAAA